MKIEYLHRAGGFTHQGPSGTSYEFQEDGEGRRVADVKDLFDQERFLSLTNLNGQPLFVALEAKASPAKPEQPTSQVDEPAKTAKPAAKIKAPD